MLGLEMEVRRPRGPVVHGRPLPGSSQGLWFLPAFSIPFPKARPLLVPRESHSLCWSPQQALLCLPHLQPSGWGTPTPHPARSSLSCPAAAQTHTPTWDQYLLTLANVLTEC